MTSWQTTISGLGCIAGGIYLIAAGKGVVEGGGLIAAGIGLMRAKDADVHSTTEQAREASADERAKALGAASG